MKITAKYNSAWREGYVAAIYNRPYHQTQLLDLVRWFGWWNGFNRGSQNAGIPW